MTLSEIHSAIPKEFHEKNTFKASLNVLRSIGCAFILYRLAWFIGPFIQWLSQTDSLPSTAVTGLKWSLRVFYWHWQGVILAGWWCLGHEAGHGTLSPIASTVTPLDPCCIRYASSDFMAVGHSLWKREFLLTPYFA